MSVELSKNGVLDYSYAQKRAKNWGSYSYRVTRRSSEVLQCIKKAGINKKCRILDLGTAEGLMLKRIKDALPNAECYGVEYSRELLASSNDSHFVKICSDVQALPLSDNSFDAVICTAVLEHLPAPQKMLSEALRVLKSDGIMVITSPDPFWDNVATVFNKNEHHIEAYDLKRISALLTNTGFTVQFAEKFMLSPFGMPFEHPVEQAFKKMGLDFLFMNQLLVARA